MQNIVSGLLGEDIKAYKNTKNKYLLMLLSIFSYLYSHNYASNLHYPLKGKTPVCS